MRIRWFALFIVLVVVQAGAQSADERRLAELSELIAPLEFRRDLGFTIAAVGGFVTVAGIGIAMDPEVASGPLIGAGAVVLGLSGAWFGLSLALPTRREVIVLREEGTRLLASVDKHPYSGEHLLSPSELVMIESREIVFVDEPDSPFETNAHGVVTIHGDSVLGSGFLISANGLVLTNAHVIDRQRQITVGLRDGRLLSAVVLRVADGVDVALLKVDAVNLPTVKLTRVDRINVTDSVLTIGTPLDRALTYSATRGIVSGIRFDGQTKLIQTDAAINPGNSGGPLVHELTRSVVGINTWTWRGAEGVGMSIDVWDALQSLGVVIESESP